MESDWNGMVRPSRHNYATYQRSGMGELFPDNLPNKYGGESERREIIKDELVANNGDWIDSVADSINPNQYILWNGDNDSNLVSITRCYEDTSRNMRFPNPMAGQEVKLHPLEVWISPFAIDQMRRVSRKVCGHNPQAGPAQVLETGGFFGGMPMQDTHGRWYTQIDYAYADENLRGTETDFTFDMNLQREMDNEIAKLGRHRLGFWHSHPTYGPFQSDERLQPYGADVQTTHRFCRAWWTVALVIDAHAGENKDTVQLGAYKINGRHDSLSTGESNHVGWRSVGIGIVKIRAFGQIMEQLQTDDLTSFQKEELNFELNMFRSAARQAIRERADDSEQVRKIQQLISSDQFPLMPKLSRKEAEELYNQVMDELSDQLSETVSSDGPTGMPPLETDPYGDVTWGEKENHVAIDVPQLPTDSEIDSSESRNSQNDEEE